MRNRTNALLGVTLLLLAVATYVVLAGREQASPATTGEATPTSCLSQAHECVTATFLGYSHQDDGTTTLSYRITNNCTETVEMVSIETGRWTRVAPTDGSRYTGTLGDYASQWIGPVGDILTQGIRFTNASPDYHSGVSDEFTITVRDFVPESPNTIRVVTKGSGLNSYSFRWMLLDPTCEKGVAPLPSPTAKKRTRLLPNHRYVYPYLWDVVPQELDMNGSQDNKPLAAVKARMIAARTYIYQRMTYIDADNRGADHEAHGG